MPQYSVTTHKKGIPPEKLWTQVLSKVVVSTLKDMKSKTRTEYKKEAAKKYNVKGKTFLDVMKKAEKPSDKPTASKLVAIIRSGPQSRITIMPGRFNLKPETVPRPGGSIFVNRNPVNITIIKGQRKTLKGVWLGKGPQRESPVLAWHYNRRGEVYPLKTISYASMLASYTVERAITRIYGDHWLSRFTYHLQRQIDRLGIQGTR